MLHVEVVYFKITQFIKTLSIRSINFSTIREKTKLAAGSCALETIRANCEEIPIAIRMITLF